MCCIYIHNTYIHSALVVSQSVGRSAKGVVLFGKTKGFWLIHSVPRYPNRISKGIYTSLDRPLLTQSSAGYEAMPDDSYGQSFICLTLSTKDSLNDIGKQLMIAHPQLYDSGISDDLAKTAPDFADFVNDQACL